MRKESLRLFSEIIISMLAIDSLDKGQLLILKNKIEELKKIPQDDRLELMINCYHLFDENKYEDNIDILSGKK